MLISASIGMAGLTCALSLAKKGFENIHVYEHATSLGFVGAGIQEAPNMIRILTQLGCWEKISPESTEILETSIRDGATNKELSHVHMPNIRQDYGFPHCTGHRAALAGGIYDECLKESSITFHLGSGLASVDAFQAPVKFTIQPREGLARQETADILLAADGVKSIVRGQLLSQTGARVAVKDTGQAAYRILLPREKMAGDPEMLALLDSNQVTRWIGEKRHWIAYPIQSKSIYNLSSIQPDTNFADAPSVTYTTRGSKSAMLKVFEDFCPLVRRMLDLVPEGEVCEWKLRSHDPLPTWVHGSVALLGDACHPTLPHLAQGAAMAIEDAAVVAEAISHCPSSSSAAINNSLRVYQLLRHDRTMALVELAAASGRALHLGDGKEKEQRDQEFALSKLNGGRVPDKWASPDTQKMVYSHDCVAEVSQKFHELYGQVNDTVVPAH